MFRIPFVNRTAVRVIYVFTASFLFACGGQKISPPAPAAPSASDEFKGTWTLNSISCNGGPSPMLSNSVLQNSASGISLTVTYNGSTGQRVWQFGACTFTVPFSNIVYGDKSVTITEGTSSCSGDCSAFQPQCGVAGSTAAYPYQISGTSLTLNIPQSPNSQDPCQANWADTIQFAYTKTK